MTICGFKGCTRELSFKMSTDPDEGHCLDHGPRYVNVPLDIPYLRQEPSHVEKVREQSRCKDCDRVITQGAKRCQLCANKVINAGMRRSESQLAFGRQPIIHNEPAAVTARAARK